MYTSCDCISMAVLCMYNYMLSYTYDQLSRLTTEQLNNIARPT